MHPDWVGRAERPHRSSTIDRHSGAEGSTSVDVVSTKGRPRQGAKRPKHMIVLEDEEELYDVDVGFMMQRSRSACNFVGPRVGLTQKSA